jgi:Fe-S-cluster containining protein
MSKECEKCGECCKFIAFDLANPRPAIHKYLKARATKTMKYGVGYRYIIESRCPHLTEENLCDIHETKQYPELCRRFDAEHTGGFYIPPGCSYRKE